MIRKEHKPDMQEIKAKISDILEKLTSETFFYYYIVFVMISLPVTEIFDGRHSQVFASQPIIVEMAGFLGGFLFIVHFIKHRHIKYYPSDLFCILLFVFALLSAFFTQNYSATAFGFYYDEWLSNFVGYFGLMFAGTMIHDKQLRKNILKAFVAVTVIQTAVATLQTFGIPVISCYWVCKNTYSDCLAYGLTQNTNWYGGLSVLLFACTSGIFLFTSNKLVRNIVYAISMLCFYTLISSEARLAWVGAFAYLVFMAVSMIVMRHKGYDKVKLKSIQKRFGILLAGMTIVIIICIVFFGRIISRLNKTSNELNSGFDGFGSGRGEIWRQGLKMYPKYWAFGIGLDNFRDVYFLDPDFHGDEAVTSGKAHNEYLQYLVTQGIFQFIIYISLLIYTAIAAVRNVIHNEDNEERFINWILLGMFIGYSAKAFFDCNIVNILPYYWITIGMLLTKKSQRHFGYHKMNKAVSEKK